MCGLLLGVKLSRIPVHMLMQRPYTWLVSVYKGFFLYPVPSVLALLLLCLQCSCRWNATTHSFTIVASTSFFFKERAITIIKIPYWGTFHIALSFPESNNSSMDIKKISKENAIVSKETLRPVACSVMKNIRSMGKKQRKKGQNQSF